MVEISSVVILGISLGLFVLSILTYRQYLVYIDREYDQYPHISYTNWFEIGILLFGVLGVVLPVSYYLPLDTYPFYITLPLTILLFILVIIPAHSRLITKKEDIVTENIREEEPETVEIDGNLKDARDSILEDDSDL